jgi:hypothetical protein
VYRYNLKSFLVLFCMVLVAGILHPLCTQAQAEHPEVRRTRGYPEYKRQKELLQKDREKGLELHLERLEIEKREYNQALEEYRKQKRKEKPLEATAAYQESIRDRYEDQRRYQEDLEDFRADKKIEKKQLEQAHLDKLEELGLPEDRPRFDIKKRTLYGAKSPFGKPLPSSGSGGSSSGASNYNPPSAPADDNTNLYTPPPSNAFDEFPPSPSFPGEDNFDLPPPPPPMPFDDGSQGMNAPFDDFPPPPPPPVDDFNF